MFPSRQNLAVYAATLLMSSAPLAETHEPDHFADVFCGGGDRGDLVRQFVAMSDYGEICLDAEGSVIETSCYVGASVFRSNIDWAIVGELQSDPGGNDTKESIAQIMSLVFGIAGLTDRQVGVEEANFIVYLDPSAATPFDDILNPYSPSLRYYLSSVEPIVAAGFCSGNPFFQVNPDGFNTLDAARVFLVSKAEERDFLRCAAEEIINVVGLLSDPPAYDSLFDFFAFDLDADGRIIVDPKLLAFLELLYAPEYEAAGDAFVAVERMCIARG